MSLMEEAEVEALVQSIGMHAVNAIGKDNLHALSAVYDPESRECEISVVLSQETEDTFLAATGKLAELQILFLGEAQLSYKFDAPGEHVHAAKATEKQYSYA